MTAGPTGADAHDGGGVPTPEPPIEGWKLDPFGRFEARRWDGTAWTAQVLHDGYLEDDPTPLADPERWLAERRAQQDRARRAEAPRPHAPPPPLSYSSPQWAPPAGVSSHRRTRRGGAAPWRAVGLLLALTTIFVVAGGTFDDLRFIGGDSSSDGTPASGIKIYGTWGTQIADGITYSVERLGGPIDDHIFDALVLGVENWEREINDEKVHFDLVTEGVPDVRISYSPQEGPWGVGFAVPTGRPVFSKASIVIFGSARGTPFSDAFLTLVMSHEWGHVLGLEHANGSGWLLSPGHDGASTITTCDVQAAKHALSWFITGGTDPSLPTLRRFACDSV